MMELDYTLNPINRTAKIVTSQGGCVDTVYITHHKEILPIIKRFEKRQAGLKKLLGIKTKRQLKNRKQYNKNPVVIKKDNTMKVRRYNDDKKLFSLLLINGQQICDLFKLYSSMKRNRVMDGNKRKT